MKFPELGIYTLPGHTTDPSELYDEVRGAEALGLGSVWISERFDVKDAPTCCGAAAAITSEIHIGTGATNHFIRHPQVTATFASTMQRILKRLWRGERIVGHDGPAGKFPYLHLASWFDERIPVLVCAFGRRSLEFVGSVFDGVILHTFMSDEAVTRAVGLVRKGVLATGPDLDEEQELRYLTARMGTYLQVPQYGELLVGINEWDPAILERFRASEVVRSIPGGIDQVATLDQLKQIRELIPDEWLPAATGTPSECADRFADQFKAGADGIIVHACKPQELAPVLVDYEKIRPNEKFKGRTGCPA